MAVEEDDPSPLPQGELEKSVELQSFQQAVSQLEAAKEELLEQHRILLQVCACVCRCMCTVCVCAHLCACVHVCVCECVSVLVWLPWSDAAATIYFVHQFCAASSRERHLFRSANPFADVEESEVAWLLERQENLLVVADWFTSLFWVCFVSSWRVFACARATQVFITLTAATIRERYLFHLARVEVRLLFKSGY